MTIKPIVGLIGSINSDAPAAETVGLCWPYWHLAIGSGRTAATMALIENISKIGLTPPGVFPEGSICFVKDPASARR
jgi:hypothetical protein